MEKSVLLTWVTSTWMVLVILAPPAWATLTWDLGSRDTNTYPNFINRLRNQVKDPTGRAFFRMPMLPRTVTPPNYILVQLRSSQAKSITVALDRNDLYVVAYSDVFAGRARAWFFPDAPSNAKQELFSGASQQTIVFRSSYEQMEARAGTRERVGLGIRKLDGLINKVHGAQFNPNQFITNQAQFLLVAIQSLSEAVRFKYITQQINRNFNAGSFTPDRKVLSIVNEWGKISESVRNATPDPRNPPNGILNPNRTLINAQGRPYTVKKTTDVKGDIGVLKYFK